jgi:protein-L-isoaspartate(D-aspartate) O-methyltransferase
LSTDTTSRADELRHALVDKIIEGHEKQGFTMRGDVERALRKVPRELFTPGVSLEEAYEDTAIVTRRLWASYHP